MIKGLAFPVYGPLKALYNTVTSTFTQSRHARHQLQSGVQYLALTCSLEGAGHSVIGRLHHDHEGIPGIPSILNQRPSDQQTSDLPITE